MSLKKRVCTMIGVCLLLPIMAGCSTPSLPAFSDVEDWFAASADGPPHNIRPFINNYEENVLVKQAGILKSSQSVPVNATQKTAPSVIRKRVTGRQVPQCGFTKTLNLDDVFGWYVKNSSCVRQISLRQRSELVAGLVASYGKQDIRLLNGDAKFSDFMLKQLASPEQKESRKHVFLLMREEGCSLLSVNICERLGKIVVG